LGVGRGKLVRGDRYKGSLKVTGEER